jgi:hypothetical protein
VNNRDTNIKGPKTFESITGITNTKQLYINFYRGFSICENDVSTTK